jgi:hypothetical protein
MRRAGDGKAGHLKWIIVLAGALTTAFGLIISASTVAPLVLKALNLPDCWTYANVYYADQSHFKRDGRIWREYSNDGNALWYEFRETHRTRDYIYLLNLTERPGTYEWWRFNIRLPVCDGSAMMSGFPEKWLTLMQVWRDPRSPAD